MKNIIRKEDDHDELIWKMKKGEKILKLFGDKMRMIKTCIRRFQGL